MDEADLTSLRSEVGARLLAAAVEVVGAGEDPLQTAAALRRAVAAAGIAGPDGSPPGSGLLAAALTQARLRVAGARKFPLDAPRMWFTATGLEQATAAAVAAHRAARLHELAPPGPVLDLCCGIGADLAALARTGREVEGVDLDPLTAAVARANLTALGLSGRVRTDDVLEIDPTGAAAVFVDPSRRGERGRTFDPFSYSPSWPFVEALLRAEPLAAAKVAPGIAHGMVPDEVEAEWVSLDGDLREACLWGPAPTAARRRASVLGSAGTLASCTDLDLPDERPAVGAVGSYLYEPDDAVIRAHLVGVVAALTAGRLLEPHLAYVTSDALVSTPVGRAYRVLEVLPFREKQLRKALRARGIGALTIKKRGVAITPEELRHRLALTGDKAATIVLSRTPGSATALLVEPLDGDGQVT